VALINSVPMPQDQPSGVAGLDITYYLENEKKNRLRNFSEAFIIYFRVTRIRPSDIGSVDPGPSGEHSSLTSSVMVIYWLF